MHPTLLIILFFFVSGFAYANDSDTLRLLKRDLGERVEVVSKREIRYCPDNACEVIKSKEPSNLLPEFFYLYLFYESQYVELEKSYGGEKSFRETAIEEPDVRKKVEMFCPGTKKSPQCILDSMRSGLGIQVCLGRYDEGKYCVSCGEKTRCERL